MTKDNYDEAYQIESRKFPAIFRMTKVNLIIWLVLLGIYVGACIAVPFVFGQDAEDAYVLVVVIVVNLLILGFAYKCITGNAHIFFQGLMLIAIPAWALASVLIPEIGSMTSWFFIVPLLWLEIMIIVEKIIHTRAQRTAMDLAEYEKEHDKLLRKDDF